MINFDTTKHETDTIIQITNRAKSLVTLHAPTLRYTKQEIHMDVTACHANGNPLRLENLLHADDYEFLHDILGIRQHIDRETGKLDGIFTPRFSQHVAHTTPAT